MHGGTIIASHQPVGPSSPQPCWTSRYHASGQRRPAGTWRCTRLRWPVAGRPR